MADDCISVRFEDGRTWNYCWESAEIQPSWQSSKVEMGLRETINDGSKSWRRCQYFLRGFNPVCSYWKKADGSNETVASGTWMCHYVLDNESDDPTAEKPITPTGYNSGICDNMGRRDWCGNYTPQGQEDSTQFVCAAVNPYITGVGKKIAQGDGGAPIIRPLAREEIWGYNEGDDGKGVGFCDCHGMGRGSAGCLIEGNDSEAEKALSELPLVCNYFRPWEMGFGAQEPHPLKSERDTFDRTRVIQQSDIDEAYKLIDEPLSYRLPLNFELYNFRSKFQKCQWWDKDSGSSFILHTTESGSPSIILEEMIDSDPFEFLLKISFCKNPDTNATPFNTRLFLGTGQQFLTRDIIAKGGGFICNGCRPECPGYSGKWNYLTEDRMIPGMPVTANQILELRFWALDWDTQEQYDKYFEQKPNFDDPSTPAIYTFKRWGHRDYIDPAASVMEGRKFELCQPAPLNNKEFTEEYVQEDIITYTNVYNGTPSPGQVHFPNLIRKPAFPNAKPLSVLYPYYNDNIFDSTICVDPGPPGHLKRHNTIYGDSIRAIGHTIRNKKVYIINITVVPYHAYLDLFRGVYEIDNILQREYIYARIKDVIIEAKEKYPDYIKSTDSEETFGYFLTDGVKIKYNADNKILIAVDYGDGSWEYRKRLVSSRWYGGVLKQDDYTHTYGSNTSGYKNTQPTSISPGGTIEISGKPLGDSDQLNIDILSAYSYYNEELGAHYYGWNIRWITKEEEKQSDWGAVGNSNIVLVEIDDIDINYIFEWKVTEAYFKPKTETDEEGNEINVGGEELPEKVELEVMIEDDDALPPNFCLLKPKKDIRYRFFNSIWELYVTYKYKKFTNEPPDPFFPEEEEIVDGGGSSDSKIWKNSPYDLVFDYRIEDVTTGPIQLLGYFYDEKDRLIACNATRAFVDIVSERCRPVDIKYQYYAEAMKKALDPVSGFCIDIASVVPTGQTVRISEAPNCGDHEYSVYKWEGPMWFPYNACRGYDLYDEFTFCNHCQAGYVGPINDGVVRNEAGDLVFVANTALRRNDFRYCGPHQQQAYGNVRSAAPSPCNCGCVFYFADARASSVIFSGYSRVKAAVDEREYAAQEWTLPPFGNDGRELVEKYFSDFYKQHKSNVSNDYYSDWMPMVMDHSMFYFPDFNCFIPNITEDEYYGISPSPSDEPFGYTNQLNFITIQDYDEELIIDERFRWEDVFEVHHEGNCSYPLPEYPSGNKTKAVMYYFKDREYAWAWQEYWKDIERGVKPYGRPGEDKFEFLELERPAYKWSAYKEENRLITDEGNYYLTYILPEIDEETKELSSYPKLALGDGPPRAFEILYNNYNEVQITWKDEGGDGAVSGSADEDNIYEEANDGNWVHSPNMLFDSSAVKNENDANKITTAIDGLTGDPTYGYYNRGVIVNMTRDRLDYLPKYNKEKEFSYTGGGTGSLGEDEGIEVSVTETYEGQELIPGKFVWDASAITINTSSGTIDEEAGISISRIYLKGNFGYVITDNPNVYNKLLRPTLSITATFMDDSVGTPRGYSSETTELVFPEDVIATPDPEADLTEYVIDIKFLTGPQELIGDKRIKDFSISIIGSTGYFVSLNEFTVTMAELKTKNNSGDELKEGIRIWERKYVVSKMSTISHNLDGPDHYLKYDINGKNGGQYFPFADGTYEDLELKSSNAHSKMRRVACGKRYTKDEAVEITYDNLQEIEKTKQRYYYEYAHKKDDISDTLTCFGFTSPKLEGLIERLIDNTIEIGVTRLNSEKLKWEKTQEYKAFKQYDYWRPGGHSYEWSEYWQRQKCLIFDTPHLIFEGTYRHHSHPYSKDGEGATELGETILNSYYNMRFETMKAKYNRAQILQNDSITSNDLLTTANPFNVT